MPVENTHLENGPVGDIVSRGRSRSKKKIIPRRSWQLNDLIFDWSDRERRATVVEAEDILENGLLSGILSPRESKKLALNDNSKPNGMSSLDQPASYSDDGNPDQRVAHHQFQYDQRPVQYDQRPIYNDNPMPKRSRSAGRYSEHSSRYHRDDYMHVAEARSSQQYRYESQSGREVRRGERERREVSYHGEKSQEYGPSYQYEEHARDTRALSQNGEQFWSPTSERATSPTTRNGNYLPGPPKPPRRQESLNRIHIPSGPDYDEEPKSPTDMEFSSTSPESGSPKHWQASPLHEPQRGFAIVGSPSSKSQAHDKKQPKRSAQTVSSDQNRREYHPQSSPYARSAESTPTKQHPQQSYPPRRERSRSPVSIKSAPSSPQKQPYTRQSSLPVSHNPPPNIPRNQDIQRASSLGRRAERHDGLHNPPSKARVTESHTSQMYSAKKPVRDPHSQTRHSDPKSRPVKDRQNSRSTGKSTQAGRSQPGYSHEKVRQHKTSSADDQDTLLDPRDIGRRYSAPVVDTERFIVADKQTAVYASPQHKMPPRSPLLSPDTHKKAGLGALLISDKDHNRVTDDAIPWSQQNNNNYYSKPGYISDSGISSLRDGIPAHQAKPYENLKQTAPSSSWSYDQPVKRQSSFNEDTAQYQLYGDGPVEYPQYGNTREKPLLPKPSSYERQSSEEHPVRKAEVPVSYSSSSLDRNRVEQGRRRNPRREILRSSSHESSDPEWKSDISHGSSLQYSSKQAPRNGSPQQDSTLERSPRKAAVESSVPSWAQYQANNANPVMDYTTQSGHYDHPKKHFPTDPRPAPYYNTKDGMSIGNSQRIKASPNVHTTAAVEADRMGITPAVDGGEAYWGMESRKPAPRHAHQREPPEQTPDYRGSQDSPKAYYERGNDQPVSSKPPASAFQEDHIQKTSMTVSHTAPTGERQSRYDRLKQRAGTQQHAQSFGGSSEGQRRSKSLTRLDGRDKVSKDSDVSKKTLQSKSTDDLEELKKSGVSRGAALFIRMMRQASMEEPDYGFSTIEPVAIDSYVGTPKLFQPQITKTGEPIMDLNRPLTSPDSDSRASSYVGDPATKYPHPTEEPLLEAQVQNTVATSPPSAKPSELDTIPLSQSSDKGQAERQRPQKQLSQEQIAPQDAMPAVATRHGNQEVPVEWLEKQQRLKRTSTVDKQPGSPTKLRSPDSDLPPTVLRGNQEVPVEWIVRQKNLKRTSSVEKRSASPTKLRAPDSEPKLSNSRPDYHESSTDYVAKHPASPKRLQSPESEPLSTFRHRNPDVPIERLMMKQESRKRDPIIEKIPASSTNLIYAESEHIVLTTRSGHQETRAGSLTRENLFKPNPVEKQAGSPSKLKAPDSKPISSTSRYGNKEAPTKLATKQDGEKRAPLVETKLASPTKLKSSDSEPKSKVRHGKQAVPVEWMEVLDRLRGKAKSQSSESSGYPSPQGGQKQDRRVSADFEDALSELEHMYSVLDQEADDLMLSKSSKPFDQRIAELPPALQKRLKDLKEYATAQRNKRRARRERAKSDLALKTKTPISQTSALEDKKKQGIPPYRSSGDAVKPTKPTSLDLPVKTNDQRPRPHHHASRQEQSSSDEEASSQQRTSSQLYRQPRSSDNLGFSSDSSPDMARRYKSESKSDQKVPDKKPDMPPGKPDSRFGSNTRLNPPESKPSTKTDTNKTCTPAQESLNNKVREIVTKSSAVVVKASHTTFEKLDAGSRLSIDSVSTIDSFQLSQPFDEISSEYHKISMDHRLDMVSDDDISPSQRSSSMESLVRSVASPGSGLQKRGPMERRAKQGREISPADKQWKGGETNPARPGPVPLATFDEELDLDIPDPALYTPVTQARHRHSSEDSYPERKSDGISSDPSIKSSTSSKRQPTKTVRPVAKLRERYSSSKASTTETSADKIRKFIEKRDSFHSSESEDKGPAPSRESGMSGRSRLARNGNAHDVPSSRTSSGYGVRAADKRGPSDGVRGGNESGERGRGKDGASATDALSSRYAKPPRHEKDKVDSIRDEYLSGRAANGEITRVSRLSRARASPSATETATESGPPTTVVDSLSRARSSSDSSEDPESRKERIAKYKEQRRKELADKYGLKDGGSTAPSSDSDLSLSKYRRDRKAATEEAGSSHAQWRTRIPVHESPERGGTRRKMSYDSSLPSSPRSPKTTEEPVARRSSASPLEYQPPTREVLQAAGAESRQRSDSISSTSSETRKRKDSVISAETQQLVDTLEASRAARRERMRRTVSDVSMDATEKIIAKHRARKGSIDSGDGDAFVSPVKKPDEAPVRPSNLQTVEGAPIARISDSDSQGSSSATSGERLRSKSEPMDLGVLTISQGPRRVPDDSKPSTERAASTKQSRARSRRQNVSITAAQIKEASAIGQKMVERKLSLTGSPQSLTSPSNSDSSDTYRKEPTSAAPEVSSQDVPSHENKQVPLSDSKADEPEPEPVSSKESPESKLLSGTEGVLSDRDRADPTVALKTDTTSPAEKVVEKPLKSHSTDGVAAEVVPEKVIKRKDKKEVSKKEPSRTQSPRVTSPDKLESAKGVPKEKKSPEKKVAIRSPEKTSKGVQQHPPASGKDPEVSSPSKVRLKRPEIPQVLNEGRKRRNSNESSSSLSDGTMSPTHRGAKTRGSDSDSRASPTLSPVHKSNRKVTEASSRIHELARPRRVEVKKEATHNGGEARKTEKRTPTSPEKKIKAKVEITSHSSAENGVGSDRSKGRDSPKQKEPREISASAKVTQRPPSSRDKVPPQVKARVGTKQTSKGDASKPVKEPPKVSSKTQIKSSKAETKTNAVKRQSSFQSRNSPDVSEQSDVKKVALAAKDKELMAMMRARARSLQDDDDEEEQKDVKENDKDQEPKPEDVIKVHVAERLQVFRTAEKLDAKPPMPPTSPCSPRSPKSPRRSSQIRVEGQEDETQRPAAPVDRSSEAEEEAEPDELAQLSVSEKKHMFIQISKQKDEEVAKSKPRRRFHRIHQSERSQTQPVTPEEYNSASTLANLTASDSPVAEVKELEVDEDDASRLSLAEKMKLFHKKAEEEDKLPAKMEVPKRKRRTDSRFKTQPVTIDEVKKASGISPLARSFTRPPDEVAGLPLAEQIALVYGSTERLERKSSMKDGTPTRRGSETSSPEKKGILKEPSFEKTDSSSDEPPKSILKPDAEGSPEQPQIGRSILKSDDGNVVQSDPELRSILKDRTESHSCDLEETKGILCRDVRQGKDEADADRTEKSILKKDSISEKPPLPSIIRKTSDTAAAAAAPAAAAAAAPAAAAPAAAAPAAAAPAAAAPAPAAPAPAAAAPAAPAAAAPAAAAPAAAAAPKDAGGEEAAVRPKDSPRKAALKKDDSQDADVDSGTDDPVKRKSGLAMEQLRLRKGKANLRAEGYSSSDSETEVRARAKSSPSSPIVEIRTVKKSQLPELDLTKKRHKSTSGKGSEIQKQRVISPRRLKTPESGRYKTQPVTPEEMAKVRLLTEPVKTAGSIAERLNALKKSGQEDWQKRINKYNDSPKTKLKDFLRVPGSDDCCQSDEDHDDAATSSISRRLELIQTSQSSWKKRVEEKDVTQFTVSGKMSMAGKEVVETSPQLKRAGSTRIKRGGSFRGRVTLGDKKDSDKKEDNKKDGEEKADLSDKSEDKSESTNSKSDSVSSGKPTESQSSSTYATTTESDSESGFRLVKKKIAVMKPDDETFAEFFSSSSTIITASAILHKDRKASLDDVTLSDFDALSEMKLPKLEALSRNRMSLRPKRRAHGTKNPIRALRTRTNVITEYEEVKKELIETESQDRTAAMKARRVELSSKSKLHQSARKGLASKEDISKGLQKLQKVKDVREMEGKLSQLLPYKDLMLLHVKGRRFVQVRLVEPLAEMLNTGDCFVLVTPKECFLWIGEYSNVIERSKSAEIAQLIQATRDLGCKAPSVITVEESRGEPVGSRRDWKKFMATLGGKDDVKDIARADEDELHEIYITETNMVYKVEGESLVPCDDYWGGPPKFAMLNSNEIFVFDFGSELYIWQGKQTSSKERQTAAKLAQIVWERGYDYREYDINPLWPGHDERAMHGEDRPEWALFGKTTEHMETVLFQNKFLDWPSESRLIKVKTSEDEQKVEPAPELVPCDACSMLAVSKEKTDLILENTNLGRGKGTNPAKTNTGLAHFEKIDQRGNEIVTLSVVVWHILEYEHSILPEESLGQFHEGDTYVVRWQYQVESTGMRDLKGNLSTRGQGHGRERCAYFFWQGHCSTINEKGASALMTVELDDERGPQRQVIQGKEPPAFLQLFGGRMVVHIGKREEEDSNTSGPNRLYCVRSEHAEEGLLVETECKAHQLRSRTSYLLLTVRDSVNKATICVWHGVKSSKATRAVAVHAANMLKENSPLETGMKTDCQVSVEEMEEGQETNTFKKALSVDRSAYDSAIGDPLDYNYTPRLFHLTSKSGVFIAIETLNQSRSEEAFSPYPFQQTDLYGVCQPAQFLLDNHYEVYLWQGWWPEDQDKRTGSAKMRWDIDRRCAMESVMAYCKEKRLKNPPKAYLVYAGLEPLTFTNLFPWWSVDTHVTEINKKEGKSGDRAILVREVLEKLSKSQYTFAELQERPLPEGVDPLKLETYLSLDEFEEKLMMGKEEFYKIPPWKQINIKKDVGLF